MGQRAKGTVTIAVVVVGIVFPGAIPRSGPTHGHRPAVEQRSQLASLASAQSDVGQAQAARAGIDVGAVVDTVRHRLHPAPDRSEALEVTDAHYRARFDAAGFVVAPVRARASVAISLTRARRGGVGMALAPTPWHGVANVARRQVAPALTERVTAREGELEWDLILARPPPGRGDLLVEARLGGLNGAPTPLADGWRLPLADAASVRLGQLVVKDAGGTELARALPRVRGKHLQLLVPEAALAGAAYPLTLDPTVSPEHPVSDPVYGGAAGDQARPAVAFDGTNFLVVWDDRRSGPAADVFGARVSRAGKVLDPAGIPIATATGDQGSPAVAFDGTNFLVVWTDLRSGTGYDVFGARVTPSGTVLDPAGIPVSTAADDQFNSAVAFDGTNFLVVWTDLRSVTSADVFGARVSRAGTVLDPAGIPISTAANDQQAPALAFDGTNFLVVWTDRRADVTGDVFGTRVSRTGTVLDPAGIPVASGAGGQFANAVAFGGTNFLVVWDGPNSDNADVFGTRVSRTGTVLDPAGVPIATAANGQLDAAVAFDGTNFLVVWQDFRSGATYDVFGARVSPAGTVLDATGIPIATAVNGQVGPAVAFDGSNFLAVWADRRSGGVGSSDVLGARVTPGGTVLDPAGVHISTAANFQSDPAVAYDGTNFLVVWTDSRSGPDDVFGARVTPSGTVLDAAGIPIATGPGDQRNPVIAFDGTNFLVAWTGLRAGIDVFAARVSRAGVVLGPTDIPVSTAPGAQSSPAVAFDGTNFLVVWQDFRSGVTFDVFGARVTRTGTVLDPAGIPISTAANGQFAPAVAFDGTNFLVAWTDSRSGAGDVFGARLSPSGTVLDTAGIPIATGPVVQRNPVLAFDGTNFLVVWEGFQPGAALDVVAARVSRAGMVLDASGIPISAAAGDQSSPAVAFDGVNFLVVWADSRPRFGRRGVDIVGARVRADGTVRDPSGLMIAGARTDEVAPAIAAVPGQGWGVVYQRKAPEVPYAATRVFLRTVSRR